MLSVFNYSYILSRVSHPVAHDHYFCINLLLLSLLYLPMKQSQIRTRPNKSDSKRQKKTNSEREERNSIITRVNFKAFENINQIYTTVKRGNKNSEAK